MTSTSAPEVSKPKVKNIANPRRLLILAPTSQSLTTIPPLLHSLTGVPIVDPPQKETPDVQIPQSSTPLPPGTTAPTTTFAGYTTHSPLRLSTKYYTAEVPLWVDEIPLSTENTETTSTQWRTEFLSAEAEIVREAVGALIVCVKAPEPSSQPGDNTNPVEREDVRAVRELMGDVGVVKSCIDEERGGMGDVPGVLILVGGKKSAPGTSTFKAKDEDGLDLVGDEELGEDAAPLSAGWWEDQMFDMGLLGWEVIEWDPTEQSGKVTRNKFGEYEGMPRIKEVLETHDWAASGDTLDADDLGSDDDFDDFVSGDKSTHSRGFGEEVNELEREMFGLRMAIERGGDGHEDSEEDENGEDKVESIEALMMRMQSIRDMSADMPEAQRKRLAAKAVQDIMKDL
ncbi:Alpha/gamma-adaptin-binding protein p34 [Penicillium cinerascens]|uniref:Alpha/gamma-adaptin-binding protein p34 n=1 Tax=Penicillium cinerascens TaxID=70096 RepID=A0A9W9NAK2_9EURO|nr:Alpha/gamma-adaptin-binding protein p34 [Penicillium cinerascens]KAJ5216282.1 Alpha/gamma-adaptin-binding protein p34 [Penicillium cinerascens]